MSIVLQSQQSEAISARIERRSMADGQREKCECAASSPNSSIVVRARGGTASHSGLTFARGTSPSVT